MTNNKNLGPIALDIKNKLKNKYKNSKKEYTENGITYEVFITERQGGSWKDIRDFFFEICLEYKDKMNFSAPGCKPCIFNGDTGIKFYENGNVYLLFIEMEEESNDMYRYGISITKCTYNKAGIIEHEKYLKKIESYKSRK